MVLSGAIMMRTKPIPSSDSSEPELSPEPAADTGAPGKGSSARRAHQRLLPAPVWQIGKLLVIALIIEYLVVPQIAGTRKALHTLSSVNPLLLLAGVALEIAAICSYAGLTRAVLPHDTDPGFRTVLRIQLTTLSVSHCVPGGTAAGSSLGYRLMTNAGVRGADVGFALGTQALYSAFVLNIVFWVALVVSIPVWGFSPLYLTAGVVGVVLLSLLIALVLLMTRGVDWGGKLLYRIGERIPFVRADLLQRLFEQMASRLGDVLSDRRRIGRATVWAALNWMLDAASLWVFVGAFGSWVNPDGLLVAYGLANVLAAIPLTPGGLGVVEATLTSALVGFNTTRAVALLGVVAYRLVNFWLPIPVGGLAYLSLQIDSGRSRGQRPAVVDVPGGA